MNTHETAKVVAKIQLGDNRQIDEVALAEWHDTIGHLEFEDAIAGVRFHRQESTEWLMPAHVIAGARRARVRRLNDLAMKASREPMSGWLQAAYDRVAEEEGRRREVLG